MAHKTITISVEAYKTLSSLKREHESFTELILRQFSNKKGGNLLEYIESLGKDEEFAKVLEGIQKERQKIKIKGAAL